MKPVFDTAIIGGGLSGCLLALELARDGHNTALIHNNGALGSAASLVPLGLFNPAAALQAKLNWKAQECREILMDHLRFASGFTDGVLYKETGVFRPIMDDVTKANFRNAFESEPWPEGWVRWLGKDEAREKYPGILDNAEGLMVKSGITVNMPVFIDGLMAALSGFGNISIYDGNIESVSQNSGGLVLKFENGTSIQSQKTVFACGYGIKKFGMWDDLPLHFVKGQALVCDNHPLQKQAGSVSARGYIAFLNGRMVIGSTYEHRFDDALPSEMAHRKLLEKFRKAYPSFETGFAMGATLWSGVRVTVPDRMPLVGPHHAIKSCYVLNGLGSKGLMYSGFCAKHLAGHILRNDPIPDKISTERIYASKKWVGR